MGIKTAWCAGIASLTLIAFSPFAEAATISVGSASSFMGETTCEQFESPQCWAREFNTEGNVADQGGSALEAVALDSLLVSAGVDFTDFHRPENANDGRYGNGASWVSASANSWLKIDLGSALAINQVSFGRDRLGAFDDRDPGDFIIEVATSENSYANGDGSNDSVEYTEIVNSAVLGFSGLINGPETLQVDFDPVVARYVKLTFANAGTAIDEVEINAVPEPITLVGSLAAVLVGVAMRRKGKDS